MISVCFNPVRCAVRMSIALALSAIVLLAACGGGGDGEIEPPGPVTGNLAPAIQGLIFVEYDAYGIELQRATPTDGTGAFVFPRAMRGARVEARSDEPSYRARTVRSARIARGNLPLQVSAVTTLFDQWVARGVPEIEIRRALSVQIRDACGAPAAAAAAAAYRGQEPALALTWGWFLYALTAYVDALRDVGHAPGLQSSEWLDKTVAHSDVLHQMCGLSATINSVQWMDDAHVNIARALGLQVGVDHDALEAFRQPVLDQVLLLVGRQLPFLEFPELANLTVLDTARVTPARALDMGLELLLARYQRQRLVAAGREVPVEIAINRRGRIEQVLVGQLSSTQPSSILRVSNLGVAPQAVRLTINGAALGDTSDIVADILTAPVQRPGESLQERAWLYLKSRSRHEWPITSGRTIHQPDLYLRSLGMGFCDDVASVLQFIWQDLGFPARVWGLDGHVVSEVEVGGRWEMYDADLGPFFFNREGVVAGVGELMLDTALMTSSDFNVLADDASAYSVEVASIYGTTFNNFVEPWYSLPFADPLSADFVIPAGAYLEVGQSLRNTMPTIDPATKSEVGAIRMWLPPGFTGTLPLPMLLADARGDASIRLDGAEWQRGRAGLDGDVEVTAGGLADRIATYFDVTNSPDIGFARIHVNRVGPKGLTLILLVNPKYLQTNADFVLSVHANSLEGLSVGPSPLAN